MPEARPEVGFVGSRDDEVSWSRRIVWLLAGVLIVRVLYAAVFPLDLAPDESYYWDWGRRPDIGYYSKPPMIGWLMGVAGWLGRDSMFALKLAPGLMATAGLVFIFLLGRDLYGGRVGWWSVLLLLATPANVALNTFFTIDAPLFLLWSASLWLAWRWWMAERHRWRWTLALAACLGLGCLTKQIQLVFPLMLAAFLVWGRRRPLPAGSWAHWGWVVAGVLLFLTPPLVWNWQHGWITFRHTAEELSDTPFSALRSLRLVGEFFGGQAGLGGGLTWILMISSMLAAAVRWRDSDERSRFLVLFCLPGLLAFTALSVHQRVEQNWPMAFYSSAVVLAAARWTGAPRERRRGVAWSRWAVGVGGALAVALLVVPFVVPLSSWSGARSDPTARIRGWRTLADRVEPFRGKVPRPARTFLLAPDDRYVASALAFYLPDRPRTYCWENPVHLESQYGIWGRPAERLGWDALVITPNPDSIETVDASRAFEGWEELGEVRVELGRWPDRDRRYHVFLGRNLMTVTPKSPAAGGGTARGGGVK